MKATVIKLTPIDGTNPLKWKFYYEPRFKGWFLVDHEGYERFFDGNWIGFVPYVRMVAENYGCKTTIS